MSEYGTSGRRSGVADGDEPRTTPERADESVRRGTTPSSVPADSDSVRDPSLAARDWREAWRAARDGDGSTFAHPGLAGRVSSSTGTDAPTRQRAPEPAGSAAATSAVSPAAALAAPLAPMPPPGGEPARGGFRAALNEGLARAKTLRAGLRTDSQAPADASKAAGPGVRGTASSVPGQLPTAAPSTQAAANGGPPASPPGALATSYLPRPDQTLAPFAGAPAGSGGPAPVPAPPGLGSTAASGFGAPAVAGTGVGASAAGIAAAASATVTDQTATLSGVPTAVMTTTQPNRRAAVPSRAPKQPRASRARTVRRAHLKLARIDPWTIMKVSFMLAIAFGIMTVVTVYVIWSMLNAAGVFESIAESVSSVTGEASAGGVDILAWVALDRVLGLATLIAVVDVVLITALATLGAFLYNLASTLLGGVEVTLVEDHR